MANDVEHARNQGFVIPADGFGQERFLSALESPLSIAQPQACKNAPPALNIAQRGFNAGS